ncbi:hypothetical protein [Natrialba sp. SSL1]|uniref:hypothetical protein n=1 Tax=Natrialba sp. SSL1 TaxID=1869245 RepID=UPI0011138177|nr:hypothetical protein [Natrialba sp. SSL1]
MKRRQFFAGFVGLASAGTLGIGSGAFSNSTAQRGVNVSVTSDLDGLLRLEPLGVPQRSSGAHRPTGTIEFSFPGDDDKKVNVDATVQYARDVEQDSEGLFEIGNEGTGTVTLTDVADEPDAAGPDIGVFCVESDRNEDGLKPLLRETSPELEPGESIAAGIEIDTHGLSSGGTYETGVTIKATRVD